MTGGDRQDGARGDGQPRAGRLGKAGVLILTARGEEIDRTAGLEVAPTTARPADLGPRVPAAGVETPGAGQLGPRAPAAAGGYYHAVPIEATVEVSR